MYAHQLTNSVYNQFQRESDLWNMIILTLIVAWHDVREKMSQTSLSHCTLTNEYTVVHMDVRTFFKKSK